jgi:26S proteasome regulatory subunit N7
VDSCDLYWCSFFPPQEKAESAYRAAFEKTVGLSHRMDITFYLIRLGLFCMDHDLITRNIEKATR